MHFALSSTACPECTLDMFMDLVRNLDLDGVELRSFGDNSSQFTPDPCLTSFPKIRSMVEDAGLTIASLATSVRFDERISPPVIGRLFGDPDRSVAQARRFIEVATQIESPFVRVFGFELQGNESRRAGMRRIVDRLQKACACANNTGVRLLLENGGSFPTAEDLVELIDRVAHPMLAASYSPSVAQAVGEDAIDGLAMLDGVLEVVKIKDFDGITPVPIGRGEMKCQETIQHLAQTGYRGWAVLEWDRLWLTDLAPAEEALPEQVEAMYRWSARTSRSTEGVCA